MGQSQVFTNGIQGLKVNLVIIRLVDMSHNGML